MNEYKKRFEKKFQSKFQSKFNKILSEEELEFILKNDCECNSCQINIQKLESPPIINIEKDILLCEICYEEEHKIFCNICDKLFDTVMTKEWFWFENGDISMKYERPPGIYKFDWYNPILFPGINCFNEKTLLAYIKDEKKIPIINEENYIDSGWICPICAKKYAKELGFKPRKSHKK
jgi:hypothetical protein